MFKVVLLDSPNDSFHLALQTASLRLVFCDLKSAIVPERSNTKKTKSQYVVAAFDHSHPPLDDPTLALSEEAFELALSWNLSSSLWPLLPPFE